MTRRRWPGRDAGSFTAEMAAGLPALMLLLLVGLTAAGSVATKIQCVDAAREAALAASRGASATDAARSVAPPGAHIEENADDTTVTVLVRSPIRVLVVGLPVLTVEATATAAREPGTPR